jgi:tRNA (guanine10-N2)-dimethyltransferase
MKYFFELGIHPEISYAELSTVLTLNNPVILGDKILIADCSEFIVKDLLKIVGGIVKIGMIVLEKKITNEHLAVFAQKQSESFPIKQKINFGISVYGKNNPDVKKIALDVKRRIAKNRPVRWVASKNKVLSSVIVEQNKLIDRGFEMVLLGINHSSYLGITLGVQPFKDLSFRDYGRPGRDDLSGMLPPKLAQIMLNLSRQDKDKKIIDPFCGSGTIITEASLMGFRNIYAGDLSEKAIADTRKNISWIKENFSLDQDMQITMLISDVRELSKKFSQGYFDAVITEPFLGPQRGKIIIKKIIKELNDFYSAVIREFFKILKDNGTIVMIWPMFFDGREHIRLNPDLSGFTFDGFVLNNFLYRKTLVYGRPGQKIWREIVRLKKQ